MNIVNYVIPILILLLFLYSVFKKQNVYELFVSGAKESVPLAISLFPYLVAIFFMNELLTLSGLLDLLIKVLSPIYNFFGVPNEVIQLVILKPLSGSGSLGILNDIYTKYGVNTYISFLASCIYGSSETVFYISAVYYIKCKNKKAIKGILISLTACFVSLTLTCLMCKIIY